MKKLFALLLITSFSFMSFSCSSDDDSPSGPQFTIVGTWKVTQIYINGVQGNVNDYCPYKGNFEFVDGGTYVEKGYELVGTDCNAKPTLGGTWIKSGNNYTLTLNGTATSTVLPSTFTPITNSENVNKFELNLSAGGIPTRLIFTKQ